MLTENTKEEKRSEKEAINMRNVLIKEGKIIDDINDGHVKELLEKQQTNLDRELKSAEQEYRKKMEEKVDRKVMMNKTRKVK
jgi:hypothetical protein